MMISKSGGKNHIYLQLSSENSDALRKPSVDGFIITLGQCRVTPKEIHPSIFARTHTNQNPDGQ